MYILRKKSDGETNMKTLKTRWTDQVLADPDHVLSEYPRPSLVRESYINLNGYWDYAFTTTKEHPGKYDGKILVPFSPEALLSGVNRQLQPDEYLWYHRILPEEVAETLMNPSKKRWILHFGAVDQLAAVYVNGKLICRHTGGYLPFSADITKALNAENNELIVVVRDCSDTSYYSRGKQKLKRGGMYYTAQSGIWQTVWLEEVPANYITGLKITPQHDTGKVDIVVSSSNTHDFSLEINSKDGTQIQSTGVSNNVLSVKLDDFHSWSPEDPFLYDLKITLGEDIVTSYFAMRKIEVKKDANGLSRVFLNNQTYFQKGLLDQGYWPDGLYTAPTDDALIFDISEMKRLGFNMLRKHCKLEPERWYYHCDRLGMLVWQDMVNGGESYKDWYVTYLATVLAHTPLKPSDCTYGLLSRKNKKGQDLFLKEMKETIRHLYNHPSIVTWVIFNEGWGQFDSNRVLDIAKTEDDTRLYDQASGWFDQSGGDYQSIHEYFVHLKFKPEERVTALTEFGGYAWHDPAWSMYEEEYGYKIFNSKEELSKGYEQLIQTEVLPNIKKGLSVTIYTQVSDIEEEVNGIYTYDRSLLKIDENILKKYNKEMQL